MKNIKVLFSLLIIGIISCTNLEKSAKRIEIAKQYYRMLDQSDQSSIATIIADSLLTKETEFDYQQTFSLKEYIDWLEWDSMFEPKYEILELEQRDEIISAKISKIDKRILFLHGEPIVSNQVIRFDKDKIASIETIKYLVFKDSIFVKNRDEFVTWVNENHPELDGFLHDQTKVGGMKYLKAMEYYEKEQSNNY